MRQIPFFLILFLFSQNVLAYSNDFTDVVCNPMVNPKELGLIGMPTSDTLGMGRYELVSPQDSNGLLQIALYKEFISQLCEGRFGIANILENDPDIEDYLAIGSVHDDHFVHQPGIDMQEWVIENWDSDDFDGLRKVVPYFDHQDMRETDGHVPYGVMLLDFANNQAKFHLKNGGDYSDSYYFTCTANYQFLNGKLVSFRPGSCTKYRNH